MATDPAEKTGDVPPAVAGFALVLAVTVLAVMYFGSDESTDPPKPELTTMGGEFLSLATCLSALEKNAGPLEIIIDKPHQVTGFTAQGHHFGCAREETGTRGTFYRGWYQVEESGP